MRVVAMYAWQSAGYIPASDWVRKFSKIGSDEAQALWNAAWNPMIITITDTDRIIFDDCFRPSSRDRYFVGPDPSHYGDNTLLTPQCDGDHVALGKPCITPERHFLSPYENIRNVLRHRTHTPSDRKVSVSATISVLCRWKQTRSITFRR